MISQEKQSDQRAKEGRKALEYIRYKRQKSM